MSQIFVSSATSTVPSDVPTAFVEDSGIAIPVSNVLNVVGGTGILTSGSGNTVTITENSNLVAIVSAPIDFNVTGVFDLFTTRLSSRLAVIFTQHICDTGIAVLGNTDFNIGWTGPDYLNYTSATSFACSIADTEAFVDPGSAPFNIFPANTDIKINIVQGDGGTDLVGRIVFYGVYI